MVDDEPIEPIEPIEPTEILPRASTSTMPRSATDDGSQPLRLLPSGRFPVLTSAVAATALVTGGVVAAAAIGGVRAAVGVGRLLASGGRPRGPAVSEGHLFGYSVSVLAPAGAQVDWMHLEVRWGPLDSSTAGGFWSAP